MSIRRQDRWSSTLIYNEATFQITKDIQIVMSGMRKETDLSAIEKSYYDAAEKFIQGRSETAEDWAAYESRLAAVGRLIEGKLPDDCEAVSG